MRNTVHAYLYIIIVGVAHCHACASNIRASEYLNSNVQIECGYIIGRNASGVILDCYRCVTGVSSLVPRSFYGVSCHTKVL